MRAWAVGLLTRELLYGTHSAEARWGRQQHDCIVDIPQGTHYWAGGLNCLKVYVTLLSEETVVV
jgi:hypothetical protein